MFTTEWISYKNIVLSYYRCFLYFLQLNLFIKNINAKSTYIENICINYVNAIEYLKINLQSFQIIKVGDAGLEI